MYSPEFLVLPLTFVINNYIARNNFPDAWKTARISPIPKIIQPVELKDYRPVSILPVLSKVYEKLVLQQLAVFIERESVYHQYQSGYRKNHSTATLLLKLHDDTKKAMKSSEFTIAIFTDYSKVFGTTDFKKMHIFSSVINNKSMQSSTFFIRYMNRINQTNFHKKIH